MIIAGIDYSITCPALVIGNVGSSFDDLHFYSFATKKRHYSNNKQITLLDYPLWKTEQERYDRLSDLFINILIDKKVEHVLMEGYSYGSSAGQVFQIAENTEVLKYKMYKKEIPFDVTPPSQIKKYFTGSGNSNKGMMYVFFKKHCPYDIHITIGDPSEPNTIGNPVSDLVDAYAIWSLNNSQYLTK